MATKKRTVSPRVGTKTEEFFASYFANRTSGAQIILDGFPSLVNRALDSIKGTFSKDELRCILDTHKGHAIVPAYMGEDLHWGIMEKLAMDNVPGCEILDHEGMSKKLMGLGQMQRVAIEIWATGFWYGGWGDAKLTVKALDRWISRLL